MLHFVSNVPEEQAHSFTTQETSADMWLPTPTDLVMLVLMGLLVVMRKHGMLGPLRPALERMSVLEACFVVMLFSGVVAANSFVFARF